MCTAVTYKTEDFYFGRTLDYEFSYGEEVTVTPRNHIFHFRHMGDLEHHYAMIGMAHKEEECPLYYEAVNEKGLGMAGLNFVGNAYYRRPLQGRDNVTTFEFIPWILAQCATVKDARGLLERINLTDERFREGMPLAQLHWLLADADEAVTIEAEETGFHIHDNLPGVLTNNPPFAMQMFQLNNYMHLSPASPENHFSRELPLKTYGRGMGHWDFREIFLPSPVLSGPFSRK